MNVERSTGGISEESQSKPQTTQLRSRVRCLLKCPCIVCFYLFSRNFSFDNYSMLFQCQRNRCHDVSIPSPVPLIHLRGTKLWLRHYLCQQKLEKKIPRTNNEISALACPLAVSFCYTQKSLLLRRIFSANWLLHTNSPTTKSSTKVPSTHYNQKI